MKNWFTIFCFLLVVSLSLSAQPRQKGNTYAVVVGISDYQHPSIPDLRFAHKDAAEFALFLQSESGEHVPTENIKLLVNQDATYGKLIAAMDWLLEVCEEDDNAVIYFSGHGDVESKTRSQLGFLLPWDSPPQSYMAGAFPLFYLEELIQTISLDKKAKVVMIADACRSGKLAGSQINGAQLTNANLAQKFANEIKILSCQTNEFSIEGEQWGGGRGIFSYHLIDGLYGEADNNSDGVINLMEIGRYLDDHVTPDAAPHNQVPVTVGNRQEKVSYAKIEDTSSEVVAAVTVDSESVAANHKDIEAAVIAKGNTEANDLYTKFKEALGNNVLMEPEAACADAYFKQLEEEPDFALLVSSMKRDFSAALHDEVQQALNALLESDPYEVNNLLFNPDKYEQYPLYLQRSIELLGPDHYSINNLKAKKYFFEAIVILRVISEKDKYSRKQRDSLNWLALNFLDDAIKLEPTAAYLYYGKSLYYSGHIPNEINKILTNSNKALELSPQWLLPYLTVAHEYFYVLKDYKEAEVWLQNAYKINPESYVVLERLCWLYQNMGNIEEAVELAEKMLQLRPDLFNSYGNMGGVNLLVMNYPEAKKWYLKSLEIENSPTSFIHLYLGHCYFASRQVENGIAYYDQLIANEKTPRWMKGFYHLWKGKGLIDFTNNWEDVEKHLDASMERLGNPGEIKEAMVLKAQLNILLENWDEAELLLQQALKLEGNNGAVILGHTLMAEIKNIQGLKEEAELLFKKGRSLTTGIYILDLDYKEKALFHYGVFLLNEDRLKEAEILFTEAIEYTNQQGYHGYLGFALLAAKQKQETSMYKNLETALDKWLPKSLIKLHSSHFSSYNQTDRFLKIVD